MRLMKRLFIAVLCSATLLGATGLNSGGGRGVSERYVLHKGSLGGFEGVRAIAGSYQLISNRPVVAAMPSSIGDFNDDGAVDFRDFLLFAGSFGRRQGEPTFESRFDLDADGAVAFGDFLLFVVAFGT